jgi:ribosomal protein S18 acetylase RimI-like enzyme
MTTIHFHDAELNQADQILAVLIAAFDQYRQQLDPPSGVFEETPDDIQEKMSHGGGIVACDGQHIVGVVLYQPHADYMYLGRLGVLPEYRGRQIATRLITQVEHLAHERNLPCVRLNVRIGLTANQKFFQGLGYTITDYCRHENYIDFTYVAMEKKLTPS